VPAKRRPSLVLSAALLTAGLAAPVDARAEDPDAAALDVLTLVSGERLTGDLVDLRDGRYWVLLPDGTVVSVDMHAVRLLERGDARDADPADLPLPDWRVRDPREDNAIGGGFDIGLTTSLRVRFRRDARVLAHIDARLSAGPMLSAGFGVFVGPEFALFPDSPVHLTLTALAGGSPAGAFPFVGAGAGILVDPRGAFEARLGAIGGVSPWGLDVVPELAVGFVW